MAKNPFTLDLPTRQYRLLNFGLHSFWVLLVVAMIAGSFLNGGVDFRGYYAAGRVLLNGGDPYRYELVAPILEATTGYQGNNPFFYPPWFALIVAPFATLPYQTARFLWITCNAFLLWGSLELLVRTVGWPTARWSRSLLFLSAAFTFGWFTLKFEQAGILVFAALTTTLWAWERKPVLAGIMLALALSKPQASWLAVVLLLLHIWRARHYRILQSWAMAMIALLALGTAAVPTWLQSLLEPGTFRGLTVELNGPHQIAATRINTTLLDWLQRIGIDGLPALAIYAAAIVGTVGLILHWCRQPLVSPSYSAALGSMAGYAIVPYALQYDYTPAIFALTWVWRHIADNGRHRGVLIVGMLFLHSILLWEKSIADGYWIVIVLLPMLLGVRPSQQQARDKDFKNN
jgi:hypothetical protein